MTAIESLLLDTGHRPFDIPKGKWIYCQEWNNALFLHWKVPVDILKKLVPQKMHIDTFEGNAYVSLVAFTMEKIRPGNLPSVNYISSFNEINLRTYIENDSRKGVYFLNIEASKRVSAFIAKKLSGLPYEKANISRTTTTYRSDNVKKEFYLDAEFETKELLAQKSELDKWLTERYCLYLDINEIIYRYDIHHKEWPVKKVDLKRLNLKYSIKELILTQGPDLTHYSDGVKVVSWKRMRI